LRKGSYIRATVQEGSLCSDKFEGKFSYVAKRDKMEKKAFINRLGRGLKHTQMKLHTTRGATSVTKCQDLG
jgi:hypothetical protein